MDPYDFDEPAVPDNKAPLFAHECVGMELYEGDDAPDLLEDEDNSADYEEDRRPSTVVYDDDEDVDLNDPTLVKFPSNRDEIIDTVRKLEGGLNEDHSDVEGLIPLSPVVGPSGPQNHDLVGDFLVSSPAVSSPIVPRGSGSGSGSRLLNLPRASLGSMSSDRSSALSLGSISEAEEAGVDDEAGEPPVLLTPKPRSRRSDEDMKSPTSDDDEAVVMKSGNDKSDKSREASSNEDTPVRSPRGDRTPRETATGTETKSSHDDASRAQPDANLAPASGATASQTSDPPSQANGGSRSPCLFAQPGEGPREVVNLAGSTKTDAGQSASENENTTQSTGVDNGTQSQVRRRGPAPDRIATPSSINQAGIQAAKSGGWFRSFFRMIFVDWIGGFISRLCGGKRET